MIYLNKLKALKEQSKLTNTDIAKLADIPIATITRIFNGSTPNPTFETFARIAIALGASLDEIAGLKQPDAPPIISPIENTLNSYITLIQEKDERIKELKEEIEKERKEKEREHKEKNKLAIALACIIGFVLLLLTVDILNGQFGYFKY